MRPCQECGGEGQVEYYIPPTLKPIQWFVRCRDCQARGPITDTDNAAVAAWEATSENPATGH